MLRITVSKNAKAATKYFEEGLSKQDYYSEKNEIIGKWNGKIAERLNLSGDVTKEDFEKLVSNINPVTNEQLNVRDSENRRAGYDFTFDAPKSVSLVHAITKDKDIINAFQDATQKTMIEIEQDMQTQKGQGKNKEYITTENIIYAKFTHLTARPVDGVPDCHLHQHCYVMNTTWNEEKQRFQATEMGTVKGNAPYYEAVFSNHLASNLQKAGYEIERNEHNFEIKAIDRNTIDKFSNRTQEIEKEAQKRGILTDKLKDGLGAKTREHKNKGLSKTELKEKWLNRLTADEKKKIFTAKNNGGSANDKIGNDKSITAKQALEYALDHHLERQSTISEKRLLGEAIKRGIGQVSPEAIKAEYDQKKQQKEVLFKTNKRTKDITITTQKALDEEKKLIQSAKQGRGNFDPINKNYQIKNEQLTAEQSAAVRHALCSRDFITVITGGAGTGKTWSIKEVANGIQEAGKNFHAYAPSAAASRGVQREQGFENANTIASLIQDKKSHEKLKDGVIWIDEAGMVDNSTMNTLIDIAKQQNARILLTGDVKQHNSVERGDSLRIIQQYGGVKPAYIKKIQRQKNANYKQAVKLISDDKIAEGYQALDKMGAIKEVVDMKTLKTNVADEYVTAQEKKEETLIVATTHAQGKEVTGAIRDKLKEKGLLAKKEKIFDVHKDKSFTDAQKQDAANYQKGLSIQFHQNAKGGFKRGTRYDVVGKDDKGNILISETSSVNSIKNNRENKKVGEKKKEYILPLSATSKFSVFEKQKIALAQGDKIRLTSNGTSNEKKRLNNGDILTIQGFDKSGNILACKGKNSKTTLTLDQNYRNLTHGYYTTSPASQGKSVNKVIIMQSSASGKASSKEQFYVSASRGKFAISVYTDDKDYMLKSVQRSASRMAAVEIAPNQNKNLDLKERFKRKENIYRTAISKSKDLWHNSKQKIANLNQIIRNNVQQQTKTTVRTR